MERYLIVNADDFGASLGINRAIAECHSGGVVTSTSLMVDGAAAADAAARMKDLSRLSVGLHFDVLGESVEDSYDLTDHAAVRREFARQLDRFTRLTGAMPTHVDSHRHAHRRAGLMPVFEDLVAPLGVPLRGDGRVTFAGGFYGQPDWLVTDLACVSREAFTAIVREHALPGWLELGCHPGYVTPEFESVYNEEREAEVRTLTDPSLPGLIADLGCRLANYRDFKECSR